MKAIIFILLFPMVVLGYDPTKPVVTNTVAGYIEFSAHDGTLLRVRIEPDGSGGWRGVDTPLPWQVAKPPAQFADGVVVSGAGGHWYALVPEPTDNITLAIRVSDSPLPDAATIKARIEAGLTAYQEAKQREAKVIIETVIEAVNTKADAPIDKEAVVAEYSRKLAAAVEADKAVEIEEKK